MCSATTLYHLSWLIEKWNMSASCWRLYRYHISILSTMVWLFPKERVHSTLLSCLMDKSIKLTEELMEWSIKGRFEGQMVHYRPCEWWCSREWTSPIRYRGKVNGPLREYKVPQWSSCQPVIWLYNQGIITAVHICHVFISGEICHSGWWICRGRSQSLPTFSQLQHSLPSSLASNYHQGGGWGSRGGEGRGGGDSEVAQWKIINIYRKNALNSQLGRQSLASKQGQLWYNNSVWCLETPWPSETIRDYCYHVSHHPAVRWW